MKKARKLLEIHNISKAYSNKQALGDCTFSLEEGSITALIGPNGSGKTTAINAILGLINLDQGYVSFRGKDVKSQKKNFLPNVGAVLEGTRNIHWRLTVEQNARYFSSLRGWSKSSEIHSRCNVFIDLLGLSDYRATQVGKLSTGNRQKAALLCALIHQPPLVLMDEPTIGLDLQTIRELEKFVISQARIKSQTFLVTSHDLRLVENICDRVVVIFQGRVVFSNTIEEMKKYLHKYIARIRIRDNALIKLSRFIESLTDNLALIRNSSTEITLHYNNPVTILKIASYMNEMGTEIVDFQTSKVSTEQAYLQFLDM